jgi:magnesium chelatase family protein
VLSALSNSALRRPRGKITINLAPATVRKEGPSFDLPIALAMLQLNEQNRISELDHCYICGELALSGEVRRSEGPWRWHWKRANGEENASLCRIRMRPRRQ